MTAENFQSLVDGVTAEGESDFRASVPESWLQGRTSFGGLAVAFATHAARSVLEKKRPLRSLQATFAAPVPAGAVTMRAERIREGKSASFAGVDVLRPDGTLGCRVQALFSESRDSRLEVPAAPPTPSKPASDGFLLPYIEGLTPSFTQFFEYVVTEGQPPFSGAAEPLIGGWVRHRTEARGEESIVALLDAWPAPVLPMGTAPFFASTVQWSCHLLPGAAAAEGPFFFRYSSPTAGHGFATVVGSLYSGDALIAWTEQAVMVFD